jgi:hypothetical protein
LNWRNDLDYYYYKYNIFRSPNVLCYLIIIIIITYHLCFLLVFLVFCIIVFLSPVLSSNLPVGLFVSELSCNLPLTLCCVCHNVLAYLYCALCNWSCSCWLGRWMINNWNELWSPKEIHRYLSKNFPAVARTMEDLTDTILKNKHMTVNLNIITNYLYAYQLASKSLF